MTEEITATVGGENNGAIATETSNQAGQQGTETQAVTGKENGGGEPQQTFTQADIDRRVQQALETAKGKWQAESEERIRKEREDAARLAQMTEKEKAEEMARRQQEDFDTQRNEFERQKSIFGAQKALAERKLPLDFAEMLAGKDEAATAGNIDAFEKAFNEAVQSAVVEKMKGSTPKIGDTAAEINSDPFLQGFGK